jgi:transposase
MPFSGCYARALNGETWLALGPTGRLFTTTAPAARFNRWKADGTFERMNLALNKMDRQRIGREEYPSLLCIDSQSVKLSPMICEYRGFDAYKRVNGRKRQLVVDTQGRLWAAHVHAAGDSDGSAAIPLIRDILWAAGERLEKVLGDQAASAVRLQWSFCPGLGGMEHRFRESFTS